MNWHILRGNLAESLRGQGFKVSESGDILLVTIYADQESYFREKADELRQIGLTVEKDSSQSTQEILVYHIQPRKGER
jgi:hypothetical protein